MDCRGYIVYAYGFRLRKSTHFAILPRNAPETIFTEWPWLLTLKLEVSLVMGNFCTKFKLFTTFQFWVNGRHWATEVQRRCSTAVSWKEGLDTAADS